MNSNGKKYLIAYFSRNGENYINGKIVNLPIGNTQVIAKKIMEITGGEMFHIDTIKPYPESYDETTKIADKELHSNVRPELLNHITDIDAYDMIFLGYPIWWGTIPMAVQTFLEEYDFSGKTIIPFCTHEGSGLGRSERDIKRLCPKAQVLNAIAFHGGSVKNAKDEVERWIKKLLH
jgi:flavodoxin